MATDLLVPRTLDWKPRHDPKSREYPVRGLVPAAPKPRLWTPADPTDQQAEGACVGHGITAELRATPVRVDPSRLGKAAALGLPTATPDAFASGLYKRAQRFDEWPGENYEGTSVLAGAKVAVELGAYGEYRWAFGAPDVAVALARGPVVLGIPWYAAMYDAPGGILRVGGENVGGHCICCIGFDPNHPDLGGAAFAVVNSWGKDWGRNGVAWIAATDLALLLREDGEAMVPWTRSYALAA